VDTSGHTALERLTMTEHRWWSRDELATAAEEVWPAELLELWAAALDATGDAGAGTPSGTWGTSRSPPSRS